MRPAGTVLFTPPLKLTQNVSDVTLHRCRDGHGPRNLHYKKTEKAQSLYFLRFKFKIVLSL